MTTVVLLENLTKKEMNTFLVHFFYDFFREMGLHEMEYGLLRISKTKHLGTNKAKDVYYAFQNASNENLQSVIRLRQLLSIYLKDSTEDMKFYYFYGLFVYKKEETI